MVIINGFSMGLFNCSYFLFTYFDSAVAAGFAFADLRIEMNATNVIYNQEQVFMDNLIRMHL